MIEIAFVGVLGGWCPGNENIATAAATGAWEIWGLGYVGGR